MHCWQSVLNKFKARFIFIYNMFNKKKTSVIKYLYMCFHKYLSYVYESIEMFA